MAKRNDLKIQLELLEDIEKLEKKIAERGEATFRQQKQLNALKSSSFELASKELDLSSQIEKLQSSSLGAASKKLGLDKQITALQNAKEVGTKKELKNANKLSKIMADVASGNKDFSDALAEIAEQDFGKLNEAANDFATTLSEGGQNLEKSVKRSKQLSDGFDSIRDTLGGINLKETFTFAGALAAITSFLGKALEVRQSLGTSAVESARLAGNMTAASLAAKAVGGSSQEAEAAVTSLVDEFGSMSVVTAGVSTQLGLITGQFGLSGANAGKLLKSMQSINGASIETNLNLISSTGELARAEGVAPAQVLNDIAENTELFAQFAKDGGQNIAQAAIEARKLGLNLGTVAGIAESLLDFESSIEREMEASMLLGKQMSLDKARELALTGDLAGLAEEVKNQVGSQAEFEAMNVVQRQALAQAIGVSVADLGKIVAGEKTSAEVAEQRAAQQMKMLDVQKATATAQIAGAIASIFAGHGPLGPVGIGLAAAGVAGVYALISKTKWYGSSSQR